MKIIENHKLKADDINRKIDKYNLIVPILDRQMCHIQLDKIAERILRMKPENKHRKKAKRDTKIGGMSMKGEENTFLSFWKFWT